MGQIKKDSRRFSVSCCVVRAPFCILSTSSSRTRRVCKKYCKNTWLLEFENNHFPCFTSLYILKTEQKNTDSRINNDFFVRVNRIPFHCSCQPPGASMYARDKTKPFIQKLRSSTLIRTTHCTLFNNQRDSKH